MTGFHQASGCGVPYDGPTMAAAAARGIKRRGCYQGYFGRVFREDNQAS